jgi:hypothetical protein
VSYTPGPWKLMATTRELRICDPCWDARNRPVDQHGCPARIVETTSCNCPCRERHSERRSGALCRRRLNEFNEKRVGLFRLFRLFRKSDF